jgi:hypothetical protein
VPIGSVIEVKVNNMARITRRIRGKKKDDESKKNVVVGQKLHKIKIKIGGDIDGGMLGMRQ